jgi:HK97 gp10 family phage protein
MPVNLSIKLQNASEIMAKLRKMPAEMTKELDTAVKKTLALVQNETMKEAPVNKQGGGGNLRQSIRSGMSGVARGKLEVGSDYGIYVHEGTRPHVIEIKNKKGLANIRTGQFFGKRVQHTGTAPNPFLQRAVESSEGEIQDYFKEAVQKVAKT